MKKEKFLFIWRLIRQQHPSKVLGGMLFYAIYANVHSSESPTHSSSKMGASLTRAVIS